jgi:exopolysaccharide production protein ExoZ
VRAKAKPTDIRLNTLPGSGDQLRSLQMLRALAAISVVYYHTFCAPHIGTFGVDLFFVLSGLVIAMVAESRMTSIVFLINRLTRIVPLYWLLTTALLIVAALRADLLNSTTADISNYLKSIFFIPYFKENGVLQPMLPVGWTLNYEMLYYVLAAIVIASCSDRFFGLATSIFVVAVWGIGHFLPANSAAREFLSADVLLEFIFGMLAWNIRGLKLFDKLPTWFLIGSIAACYVSMGYFELRDFPVRALTFGLPSFFIVTFALRLEPKVMCLNQALVRWLTHCGDASYATYLSHLFVVQFVAKVISSRLHAISPSGVFGAIASVIASLAVGSGVYILIDKKSVSLTRRFARRHFPMEPGIAGSAVTMKRRAS